MSMWQSKVVHGSKHSFAWLVAGVVIFAFVLYFALQQRGNATREVRQPSINPVKLDYAVSQPLPDQIELSAEKIALGERLFKDPRLSGNDTISCESCHNLERGGADGLAHSVGMNGALGAVNAPTVFNSGFNLAQFWDGRAATLEEQIEGPISNPKEMASSWPQVVNKLAKDPIYATQFRQLYASGLSASSIKDALATFERSLVTPNSRFDQFLRGNKTALSAQEQHGYDLFQSYGCSSCHQGINLGGNMFEKMGLLGDYFADRGYETEADLGRFKHTRDPEHMHEFKVPSLRNVALTAPYFHDGHAQTLQQAVIIMARYQLNRDLPRAETEAISAFLGTLTGEYRGKPL